MKSKTIRTFIFLKAINLQYINDVKIVNQSLTLFRHLFHSQEHLYFSRYITGLKGFCLMQRNISLVRPLTMCVRK